MNWKKGWVLFISLVAIFCPLGLEAKVGLKHMNLLEEVDTQLTEKELTIKFDFKKPLVHLRNPLFLEKSIQVDFPLAYSQPVKQFLKTGDSEVSQVYVSQFDSRTMRVRFILDEKRAKNYKKRFHMKKEGNSLVVRIDRETDILGQLLARTAEKIKNKKQINSQIKNNQGLDNKSSVESKPIPFKVKKTVSQDFDDVKGDLSEQIKPAIYKKEKSWKSGKSIKDEPSNSIKKTSFGIPQSIDEKEPSPVGLIPSGLRMLTTLSLVLGLIFLLFFGFKKYVLKNTAFGGGKLVKVLSTSFLAPKKNITLVEVAGEILVLGVSDQNISLLTSIREPRRIEEIKSAHGDNNDDIGLKSSLNKKIAGKNSLASSNAANMFSKYLKQFSGSGSGKQDSVDAVTAQIRRHMGKVRAT
jgi:flagellar biosynthetic protein FliO